MDWSLAVVLEAFLGFSLGMWSQLVIPLVLPSFPFACTYLQAAALESPSWHLRASATRLTLPFYRERSVWFVLFDDQPADDQRSAVSLPKPKGLKFA